MTRKERTHYLNLNLKRGVRLEVVLGDLEQLNDLLLHLLLGDHGVCQTAVESLDLFVLIAHLRLNH